MSEVQGSVTNKTYHVRLGIAEYTVSCRSEAEAVQEARDKLSHEMPQMASVIGNIMDKHIRVDQVG